MRLPGRCHEAPRTLSWDFPDAVARLSKAGSVIAMTAFDSEALRESADLLLPIGTWAETSGTYVNVEGRWQSFSGVANPVGQARPAWKVLRVIGNLIDVPQFEFLSSEEVRDELKSWLGDLDPQIRHGTEVGRPSCRVLG